MGYKASLILDFVGLASSTYYENTSKESNSLDETDSRTYSSSNNIGGRPIPGYSLNQKGEKISDEQIKEWLNELVCDDGFSYGYNKLTVCLREDYNLRINRKKVYRLCKELNILRPQRKIKRKHPRRLAKPHKVEEPNQLWEMDVKYGYITGTDSFFFQLSLIDVFDRNVIDHHLGLSCKAKDAARLLKNSLAKRGLTKGMVLPIITA